MQYTQQRIIAPPKRSRIEQLKGQIGICVTGALNLLFPPQCVACKRLGWWLCPQCAQTVEAVGNTICMRCGRPQLRLQQQCITCRVYTTFSLEMVRIAAIHATPLREAIHALKYDNRPELADLLARYLLVALMESPACDAYLTVDGVIPVPLHEARLQERGYNQSALLARAFCEQSGLPLQSSWLMRQRPTQSQVGLRAEERQTNVADAFVANAEVRGKRIVLLDDVYTTGATLQACAMALQAAGATTIYGLALACPR